MTPEQLKDLADGSQVVLTTSRRLYGDVLPIGTILTRKKDWLDDDRNVKFTYTKPDGGEDYHFFSNDTVEFIKE